MSGEPYIGALDQGTSGTRFVVFDTDGTPVSRAFTGYRRRTDGAKRFEYDPLRLWSCATDAIRRALVGTGIDPSQLCALGISSQRQTLLLWEAASGEPVTDALSWQDRRATDVVADLGPDERALVRDRTGLEPDAYFAAPKARWLLEHAGDGRLQERAAAGEVLLGTIDSWLVYNLTGTHATDVTNAAQTMLFDVHGREWDEDVLAVFDVPRGALPTVHPSSDPDGFGRTDPDGILDAAIPVTGVIGDQQAALLSRAVDADEAAKVTYGTGNFFLQDTGRDPVDAGEELLTTIWFQQAGDDPRYGIEGPVFATGAVLQWLETIGLLDETDPFGRLADTSRTDPPVRLVPGFGGLGAPNWLSGVGTAVFGITRQTRGDDVVRAAVEAIAFGTRAVVETAEAATGVSHDRLLVDGGAVQDDDFAEYQADLVNRTLHRAEVTQTTALGAAIAAGLGRGTWESLADAPACRSGGTFWPSSDADEHVGAYRRWCEAVETLAGMTSAP
jgi:glycerol kinase